jgi:hypothetical protein
VKFMQKFYQSALYVEYQNNLRLQWMMVGILVILTLSLLKSLSDGMQQQRSQTQDQIELLAKLELAAKNGTNDEVADRISGAYFNWIKALPKAASSSVAEAQALTSAEQQLGRLFTRKRLNLLGSEQLNDNGQVIWQVRIEVSGQMAELDFIKLLQGFDSQNKHARIASFRYSPKASNTINIVIDLIYIRAENA